MINYGKVRLAFQAAKTILLSDDGSFIFLADSPRTYSVHINIQKNKSWHDFMEWGSCAAVHMNPADRAGFFNALSGISDGVAAIMAEDQKNLKAKKETQA